MDMPISDLARPLAHPLDRLTAALGIQVAALSDPAMAAKIDTFTELLRLWEAMPGAPARNRILAAARREVIQYNNGSGASSSGTLALGTGMSVVDETTEDIPVPSIPEPVSPALASIASALGVSVTVFSDPAVLRALDGGGELNRLWKAIDCEASRQAILNVARVLVGFQNA